MSIVIAPADVREFVSTDKSDNVIQSIISYISQADSCLIGSGITDDMIRLLKIYAVAHQITLISGGQVSSESNIAGNSVSYAVQQGEGLMSTTFGQMLKGMKGHRCIEDLLYQSDIQFFSVGRRK